MLYKSEPNGACLDNCVAVHVYEDEEEASKLKKRINIHVADNWDSYYQHKIPLPYVETSGVGEYAKKVKKETREEMLKFLRGEDDDDSLMVYSNSQQILAYANFFNIKISIFTYSGDHGRWSEVSPDPEMSKEAEFKFGKCIPDMAVYHKDETHFDLLVRDDSRLALLGLLAGSLNIEPKDTNKTIVSDDDDDWVTVITKKRKEPKMSKNVEELLIEDENKDDVSANLEEEITLMSGKQSGTQRVSPHESPVSGCESVIMLKCNQCDSMLESEGLLKSHMQMHLKEPNEYACQYCDLVFESKSVLEEHISATHAKTRSDEWNCNDCAFQANDAPALLNHLKTTGHQPSKDLDRKKVFNDYKQCYTCNMEFDGYFNLMNHRKVVHPSNKRCRNFPGSCTFGNECWYVHQEPMEIDQCSEERTTPWNFKCNLCDEVINERRDFMKHKKMKHGDTILDCQKFLRGECSRTDESCWFMHNISENDPPAPKTSPKKQVFQMAPEKSMPPDQMTKMFQMISTLCLKVEQIETRFQQLVK